MILNPSSNWTLSESHTLAPSFWHTKNEGSPSFSKKIFVYLSLILFQWIQVLFFINFIHLSRACPLEPSHQRKQYSLTKGILFKTSFLYLRQLSTMKSKSLRNLCKIEQEGNWEHSFMQEVVVGLWESEVPGGFTESITYRGELHI